MVYVVQNYLDMQDMAFLISIWPWGHILLIVNCRHLLILGPTMSKWSKNAQEQSSPNTLSLDDVLEVHLFLEGSELKEDSVQFKAYIGEKWKRVIRYDTAHGYLHVHRAWRHEEDHETVPQVEGLPYAAVLPWVEKDIKQNWARYRRYIEAMRQEDEKGTGTDGEEE